MQKVNGNEVGTYDGIVRIIHGNKGKTIYLVARGDENDTLITLNDCLEEIEYDGKDTVLVIFDDWLGGKIYMYGNYGDCWYEYGETRGYA
jgi:hypothetical protein